jgi:hypothetical protein
MRAAIWRKTLHPPTMASDAGERKVSLHSFAEFISVLLEFRHCQLRAEMIKMERQQCNKILPRNVIQDAISSSAPVLESSLCSWQ